MSKELALDEKKAVKQPKPDEAKMPQKQQPAGPTLGVDAVLKLQRSIGNRAVQRMLAQRKGGEDGFELDDGTSQRINQARGGGQALDSTVQTQMSGAMGHDFSGVKVHDNAEADSLNQEVGAKAFTTGQDVFFKQGEYNPSSSDGQELIAHELTHVVQQNSGQVESSGSGMTVRPAGDVYEQEADATAKEAVGSVGESVQRQEEEEMQAKRDDSVQRQEEEEEAQPKRDEAVQRQEEEEEEMMPKRDDSVQRQEEEEEEMMPKRDDSVQRQPMEEEEEMMQPKRDDSIQRQEEEEMV